MTRYAITLVLSIFMALVAELASPQPLAAPTHALQLAPIYPGMGRWADPAAVGGVLILLFLLGAIAAPGSSPARRRNVSRSEAPSPPPRRVMVQRLARDGQRVASIARRTGLARDAVRHLLAWNETAEQPRPAGNFFRTLEWL